ncbi:hypothetical protein [Costertonia aggregata]|uniref:Uncharacterized protein n=1 Tax=Costertonia aggregata TaxID=343403 RepID=A0A7H9AQG5_9FLAO|nr:hypothetical protein [Costertonia aggregata]QLG45657.1 hypothetical protein HYG79_09965 [Costertonia aggregata]
MIYRLTQTQKMSKQKEKIEKSEWLHPLYYTIMCLVFGSVLTLSALNGFLFFGWLTVSMLIVFGLAIIHLAGQKQTKRYSSKF